jgi:pimeloyl-ACP methyl ester carboxylesterase
VNQNRNLTNNTNSFEIPKGILITGKVLQFISKNLATKFAARIFSTPLKFNAPERELMMRKSAKNQLIEIPAINKKVMVYSYGFSKKKILLAHGWAGRGTQLIQLADKILENKMMVVSFDGPAHGLSTGKTTSITEFIETIDEIDKQYGPFDAAIGHSFGAISLLNSVATGLSINKLVTIGADNSIPHIFKNYVNKIELKPIIVSKLEDTFEKKYKAKVDSFSSGKIAKKVGIPTLVIHDSQDKYVDVRNAITIRQNLKYGELLITNGLGHHKIFINKEVIQRIIDFIK